MAVPSADRKRRPILLSLSLFLLLSALLVLLFLFLGPSTQSLPFLPSRFSSTPSLPPHQHQPTPTPTPIPTPGSSPDPQPNAPAPSVAKAEEKADTSTPDAPAAVAAGSGSTDTSRPVDHTSDAAGGDDDDDKAVAEVRWETCKVRRGVSAADYIPCLDNIKAIKALRSRKHMEHRERHCPAPPPRCLVRTPAGYRLPVPWPRSRDMVRNLRACLCRFGTTMFLTQNWWSTKRTRNGLQGLVIILFSLEVELNSKMVLQDTFSL